MGEPIKGRRLDGANNGSDYVPSRSADLVPQGGDDTLSQEEDVARISVNLDSALNDPVSPDNLTLRDGDRIRVPKVTNVVTVIGAVLHPHSFAAGGGKNAEYYIQRSGGFSPEASKGDVVVVRTNGDAMPMRSVKSVMPGDIIVVPTTGLIDITKKWEKVGNVTKVVSDILSSVFVLTRF
jgi:protein involved in polysaccharide export with SLBB domain